MADTSLANPDPDAPALVGGEYGAPAFQSIEQPSGERTVGQVPRATMVQPAPLGADFGVFHDLVPQERPQVGGVDFGVFSDLIPKPPPSITPASDAVVAATGQIYGSSGPTTAEAVGMEKQFQAAHPRLYGVARGVAGMIPTPEQVMQAGEEVNKASEHPLASLAALPGEIVSNATEMGKAARGDYGPEAQAQTITGAVLTAAPLLHLPFAKGVDLAREAPPTGPRPAVEPAAAMRPPPETPTTGAAAEPTIVAEPAPETPAAAGHVTLYQGRPAGAAGREGTTFWTTDLETAQAYAKREGAGGTVNVIQSSDLPPESFADPRDPTGDTLLTPEQYSKQVSKDIGAGVQPKQIREVLSADTGEPITPAAAEQPPTVAEPAAPAGEAKGGQLTPEELKQTGLSQGEHITTLLEEAPFFSEPNPIEQKMAGMSLDERIAYRNRPEFKQESEVLLKEVFQKQKDYEKGIIVQDKDGILAPATLTGERSPRGDYYAIRKGKQIQLSLADIANDYLAYKPTQTPPPITRTPAAPIESPRIEPAPSRAVPQPPPRAAEPPLGGEKVANLQTAYDKAAKDLEAIGSEPHKPSPEKRFFGTRGREGAKPEVVSRYDTEVQNYNRWRRQYSKLKKAEVEASNELFRAKREAAGEAQYMHPSERPEVPKITEVPPERIPPEPESNDWTTATEPIEKQAGKLRLKADKEGGFVDLSGVQDLGRRIYERGVDFARWSAEMIRHLGEKIKPHLQAVWDSLTGKNMLPGTGESGGIGKTGRRKAAFGAKLLPGYSELDALTGKRSAKLQNSTADVERITKEFKKVAKTPRVENAMSAWAEAQGDIGVLKQQEQLAKGKMMKQAAKDAQKLTPEQQALALKGRRTFDIMGKRVAHYGMLNNFRQNYVPHLFDVGMKLTGFGSAKLQSKFKFAKAAKYQSFFEADQAGLKPKTMEMGKLLGLYTEHANQLIADRQFVQGAQKARSEAGEPLLAARGRAGAVTNDAGGKAVLVNPHSLKKGLTDLKGNPVDQSKYTVDTQQPALRDWQFAGKDTAGNPIFSEDDLAMHPEFAKRLRAMTGRSRLRMLYDKPEGFEGGFSVVPRAALKFLDTAQAVMKREMFGLLAPFHQVQEGTHAIGHTVNPLFNIPPMHKLTPAMIDAAEHGLILKSERGSMAAAMEGVGGKGQWAAQAARKFGGRVGAKIADVMDGYQDFLFEHYIPGLKFKTYEHMLPRNMKLYSKELASGEVTAGDIKMLTAQQSNAAYGKLNLALLDRSPTLQHILQGVLIAPDFLEARGKFVSQAAKSFMGSKAGQEQLRAIAVLTMTQAGLAYVITKGIGGEWNPKKPFDVNNADGTRSYFLRSVPEDFARLVLQGTDKRREFISARINPLLTTLHQIFVSGRNYRGEKITAADSAWEFFNNYIPIIARSAPGLRELTKTSRDSPISPLERLFGSLGVKINRTSPITKTYTMAHDWKTAQGIPADTGTYPVSKYQQMRYALEDNNQEKAADEFQKLLDAAGGDRKKVLAGFHESLNHPFTESMAMDIKFRNSLDGPSRAIYDAAKDRRHEIMRRFNEMKALEVRAVSR